MVRRVNVKKTKSSKKIVLKITMSMTGSSSNSREAPGTKNFKGEHRKGIAKAA